MSGFCFREVACPGGGMLINVGPAGGDARLSLSRVGSLLAVLRFEN